MSPRKKTAKKAPAKKPAVKTGKKPKEELFPGLEPKEVRVLLQMREGGKVPDIARTTGVPERAIRNMIYGKTERALLFQEYLKQIQTDLKNDLAKLLPAAASNMYSVLMAFCNGEKYRKKKVTYAQARLALQYLVNSRYLIINPDQKKDLHPLEAWLEQQLREKMAAEGI